MKSPIKYIVPLVLLIVVACVTSPLGRKQMLLLSESQMNDLGAKSFEELKQQTPIETDAAINQYVKCITTPITTESDKQIKVPKWEVVVFKKDELNAFALPGGKIGVYTGMIKMLQNDGQLAAVIGHEVGHVIAQHGNERVSDALGARAVLMVLDYLIGNKVEKTTKNTILVGLGLATQFGVLLPFSRTHESEADVIGLQLMAKAGFDPNQAVEVWKLMKANSGGSIPEIMSTHPSDDTRIANLSSRLPEAMGYYSTAQSAGKKPVCPKPKL
jgi:predicted Zn-dependent protease